jgi:hypothetical protein
MPTCDEITEAVGKFNGEDSGNDLALMSTRDAIQSLPPSVARSLAEVCLIADWGTIQLIGFPFRDRVDMARGIEASWPELQSMQRWRADAEGWEAGTTMLTDAVDRLKSHTHLLPTPGAKKRQLSFLSKYLHFCVNDAFPIWDGNARAALHNYINDASWETYGNWVIRVRQEAATHRTCCLERLRLPGECLLRTLDKALYILGREILAAAPPPRRGRSASA